jgi:hypothetical protein
VVGQYFQRTQMRLQESGIGRIAVPNQFQSLRCAL